LGEPRVCQRATWIVRRRAPGLLQRGESIVFEGLGDLTPPLQTALGLRQGLHRRLDLTIRVADAQGVAGPVETPVIGIEVGVCDLQRGFRSDDETRRAGVASAEPVLDRLELADVELPLYLLMILGRD